MKTGIEFIAEERKRHFEIEGWTPEHDQNHTEGELANAAAYYAMTEEIIDFMDNDWGNDMHLHIWPFDLKWLKRTPDNRIKELSKAGALIAAEIDRLNYFEKSPNEIEVKEHEILFDGTVHHLLHSSPDPLDRHYVGYFSGKIPFKGQILKCPIGSYWRVIDNPKEVMHFHSMGIEKINL